MKDTLYLDNEGELELLNCVLQELFPTATIQNNSDDVRLCLEIEVNISASQYCAILIPNKLHEISLYMGLMKKWEPKKYEALRRTYANIS